LQISLILIWLLLSFAAGIILGKTLLPSLLLLSLGIVFCFVTLAYLLRQRKILLSDIFILISFFLLGMLWIYPLSVVNVDSYCGSRQPLVITVESYPESHSLKSTYYARIKRIAGLPVDVRVRVNDFTLTHREYLTSYEVEARLTAYRRPRATFYSLWIKKNAPTRALPASPIPRFLNKVSYAVNSLFENNLSPQAHQFLSSTILGRRELLSQGLKDDFSRTGASHLLAISGLHVGIVALVVFFLLKSFGLPHSARLITSIVFLFIYALICGMRPSIVRATVMFTVFALGFFFKRRVSLFNSLALAGFVCLLIRPQWLFTVGFQLSFLATLSIIAGFRWFSFRSAFLERFLVIRYATNLFFASLFVHIGLLPLISYYFGKIYLASIAYNIVLIPYFTLIVASALAYLMFSFSFLGKTLALSVSFLVEGFIWFVQRLGSFRFASLEVSFTLSGVIFYYVLLVALLVIARNRWKNRRKLA